MSDGMSGRKSSKKDLRNLKFQGKISDYYEDKLMSRFPDGVGEVRQCGGRIFFST